MSQQMSFESLPITMNTTTRIHYRDHLIARSCLESSPVGIAPKRPVFSVATHCGNRTHSQLHQLKQRLLRSILERTTEEALFKPLCGAANQAAELAWDSPCPLLLFPCLFEELAQALHEHVLLEQSGKFEDDAWLTTLDLTIADEQTISAFH